MDLASAHPETALTTIPDDLQAAARAYFPDAAQIATVPRHPNLVRISTSSGSWRVRRWPEGTLDGDVTFSHDVMSVARNANLTFVPELFAASHAAGDATLRLGNHLYDAQRWIPGKPAERETAWPAAEDRIDTPVTLTTAAFSDVVTAVARLHNATAAMAAKRDIPSAPLSMLPGAVRQAQARHLSALRPKARHEPAIQRWLSLGERLIATAEPLVTAASDAREGDSCVLHLNLWPAHVLLDDGSLSGLLGWERVAAGPPLLDVAQAILRLQGWQDQAVEEALGAYGEIRELAPDERRLLPAVAALDAVATTGRLLEQTYANLETERPPPALRTAIEMMLRSMTALDRNLNAPSAKSRRRVWNRQAPPPGGRPKGGKPRERRR